MLSPPISPITTFTIIKQLCLPGHGTTQGIVTLPLSLPHPMPYNWNKVAAPGLYVCYWGGGGGGD